MLKGIPKVLSPEMLKVLCEMGHADMIVLGDANFPAKTIADQGGCAYIRADGIGITGLVNAILKLLPLDYSEKPVKLMAPDRDVEVNIWDEYKREISRADSRGENVIEYLDRFAFYDAAKQAACVVQTGETAIYANIIIQKGVVE